MGLTCLNATKFPSFLIYIFPKKKDYKPATLTPVRPSAAVVSAVVWQQRRVYGVVVVAGMILLLLLLRSSSVVAVLLVGLVWVGHSVARLKRAKTSITKAELKRS